MWIRAPWLRTTRTRELCGLRHHDWELLDALAMGASKVISLLYLFHLGTFKCVKASATDCLVEVQVLPACWDFDASVAWFFREDCSAALFFFKSASSRPSLQDRKSVDIQNLEKWFHIRKNTLTFKLVLKSHKGIMLICGPKKTVKWHSNYL